MTPSQSSALTLCWIKRFLIGLVVLSIAGLGCLVIHSGKREGGAHLQTEVERPYDKFRVGEINLVEYDHEGLIIRLSVEEVIHRKRRSRLFEYQNLKELRFAHTLLDIYPRKPGNSSNNYGIPYDLLGRCFHFVPGSGTPKPIESYLKENSDIDLDVLSRIQFDDLVLNIHYPTGASLAVTAEKAYSGGDFQSFVLVGSVRIITPHGENVHAPLAVFSRKFDGILFPSGHFRQESYEGKKTFYRLNTEGSLLRLTQFPDIKYVDPLEVKEEELYDKIFRKLPPFQRIMFGITALQ